jgi:transposase
MELQPPCKSYPTDVSEEDWAFVAPYLTLITPDAPRPRSVRNLREVYNALHWAVRIGALWRMLPTNFPPSEAVYHQTHR